MSYEARQSDEMVYGLTRFTLLTYVSSQMH